MAVTQEQMRLQKAENEIAKETVMEVPFKSTNSITMDKYSLARTSTKMVHASGQKQSSGTRVKDIIHLENNPAVTQSLTLSDICVKRTFTYPRLLIA